MKSILIQTRNDRGNEVRVSTNKEKMELTIFYKDSIGTIRSFPIQLAVKNNDLEIAANSLNQFTIQGKPAEKLDYKE